MGGFLLRNALCGTLEGANPKPMTHERTNILRKDVEASFLFTSAEKEALSILCDVPDFFPLLEECLSPVLNAEKEAALAIVPEVSRESVRLLREIERHERFVETSDASMQSVFV